LSLRRRLLSVPPGHEFTRSAAPRARQLVRVAPEVGDQSSRPAARGTRAAPLRLTFVRAHRMPSVAPDSALDRYQYPVAHRCDRRCELLVSEQLLVEGPCARDLIIRPMAVGGALGHGPGHQHVVDDE
jgi:hypothetical protein